MEQIDYEKEVKKSYSKAYCWINSEGDFRVVIRSNIHRIELGFSQLSKNLAWKDAYERLQKEYDSLTDNCSEI